MASSFSHSSSSEQVSSLFSSIPASFSPSSTTTIPNFPIIPSLSTIGTPTFSTPNTIYPTHPNTTPSIFSHPVFTVSNIKTFVPETLTHENYAIWKELMIPVFKSKGVYGHIDGTDPCPPSTSPNFEAWMQIDFQILSWIHATISTEVLQMIIQPGKTLSAKEAWDAIQISYQNQLAARKMYVKQEFISLHKQPGQSMISYLQYVKKVADNMHGVGESLTDRDIVMQAIGGLDAEYNISKRTIPQRLPFPSFLELQSLLLTEEATLQREKSFNNLAFVNPSSPQALQVSATSPNVGSSPAEIYYSGAASRSDFSGFGRGFHRGPTRGGRGFRRGGRNGRGFFGSGGRGSFGSGGRGSYSPRSSSPNFGTSSDLLGTHGRGSFLSGGHSLANASNGQHSFHWQHSGHGNSLPPLLPTPNMPQNLICQLCGQATHSARECRLLNGTHLASISQNSPAAYTATAFPTNPDSTWHFDSGANTHVSSTPGTLLTLSPYSGSDVIQVGNGNLLPVTHVGHSFFSKSGRSFTLNNVLVSPSLRKNLISVRQFTKDNNCSIEFDSSGFSIKDIKTKTVLLRCNSSGGLYPLSSVSSNSPTVLSAALVSPDIWHLCLGHPGFDSVYRLAQRGSISSSTRVSSSTFCHTCQLGKHTRLPFNDSCSVTSAPFDLVHSDVWTSPVESFTGIRYYLLFLDDYSHYLWVYPLHSKSQVFQSFLKFSTYVSTQFGARIKAFQCDNGREFDNLNFATYFQTHGIHLRSSCPSTPQQNGKAERMNRTILNMIRSLLFQANLPSTFWVEALYVVAHLINILPCSRLHFSTPHETLFGTVPTYDHLRVFGCACYPNLSSTAAHKLAPRSSLCIFLGYPSHHKGYRCLDLKTNKIILSRHVTFDESTFPYSNSIPTIPHCAPRNQFRTPFHLMALPLSQPQSNSTVQPTQLPSPSHLMAQPPTTPLSCSSQPHQLHFPAHGPTSPTTLSSPPTMNHLSQHSPPSSSCPSHTSSNSPNSSSTPTASLRPELVSTEIAISSSAKSGHAAAEFGPAATESSHAAAASSSHADAGAHPSLRTHSMVTRSQVGIRKPRILPSMVHTSMSLQEPKTFKQAQHQPEWQQAMCDEYLALLRNNTWILVPPPSSANIVGSKWVYRIKQRADGTIERYKARLVAQGYTQQPGVDYDETFSPVVKPVTIRTVLALAISKSWPIHQLDVKNAFLNGYLSTPVFMSQPPGFVDPTRPNYVCLLQRALYGLKQAPRAWFQRFAAFLFSCGFTQAYSDTSMFMYRSNGLLAILLLYVDDIILTASTQHFLDQIISLLKAEFLMTDLGTLNYFLGITAQFNSDGLFLSQTKYLTDLLVRTGMAECNAVSTPLTPKQRLATNDSPPFSDSAYYRSIVGALQYLTFTRPDIAFAVNQVCQYMHNPTENHFQAVKRILRYLKGTLQYGLQLFKDFSLSLHLYSDADWAGCFDSRRSTSGYCLFFGRSLISWSSKKQHTVARSSAEAEYRAMANAVAEVIWVKQLLAELHFLLSSPPVLYCDNLSAIYLSLNPVQHQRTKHIEIDIHFVRERVASRFILLQHVPSAFQRADILTKALSTTAFCSQRSNLCVLCNPAQIAGG
ncbi:hypothetical protein SLA2020_347760 [Shorea laevis]